MIICGAKKASQTASVTVVVVGPGSCCRVVVQQKTRRVKVLYTIGVRWLS